MATRKLGRLQMQTLRNIARTGTVRCQRTVSASKAEQTRLNALHKRGLITEPKANAYHTTWEGMLTSGRIFDCPFEWKADVTPEGKALLVL